LNNSFRIWRITNNPSLAT